MAKANLRRLPYADMSQVYGADGHEGWGELTARERRWSVAMVVGTAVVCALLSWRCGTPTGAKAPSTPNTDTQQTTVRARW